MTPPSDLIATVREDLKSVLRSFRSTDPRAKILREALAVVEAAEAVARNWRGNARGWVNPDEVAPNLDALRARLSEKVEDEIAWAGAKETGTDYDTGIGNDTVSV